MGAVDPRGQAGILRREAGRRRRTGASNRRERATVKLLSSLKWILPLVTLLAACTQGEGGPCQLDRDCDDGLICRIGSGQSGARGVCRDPDEIEEEPDMPMMDSEAPDLPDDGQPEFDDEDAG